MPRRTLPRRTVRLVAGAAVALGAVLAAPSPAYAGYTWVDVDGDSVGDFLWLDVSGDNIADAGGWDDDGNGVFEASFMDIDYDGSFEMCLLDANQNGLVEQIYYDLDDNGTWELTRPDFNEDGLDDRDTTVDSYAELQQAILGNTVVGSPSSPGAFYGLMTTMSGYSGDVAYGEGNRDADRFPDAVDPDPGTYNP